MLKVPGGTAIMVGPRPPALRLSLNTSALSTNTGSDRHLKGKLDEVKIWNISLNSSEILDVMGGDNNIKTNFLVLYFDFEQISGNTCYDQSGNNNNGTIVGATPTNDTPYNTSYDIDGDGLSDGDEVNVYGTDPNNADTDDDGLSDGEEIALGFDPNNFFSNSFITILIIIIPIGIICVISLAIVGNKINKKRKESFNDTLILEIEAKIKEGEEFKVKGELEKVLNICKEQLLSSKKLYDSENKEKTITKIKNLIDETMVLTIEENIRLGELLNNEGYLENPINKFKAKLRSFLIS